MSEEPRNEAEFLDRESRLAREALRQLRNEMLDSLTRTADVDAWTRRYPWQSLGTAAIAGLGTGWALGKTFRGKPTSYEAVAAAESGNATVADATESPSATTRLLGGLGTLTGALASAAFTAAAEALKDMVTDSVHSALNPTPDSDNTTNDNPASPEDSTLSP